MPKCRSIKCFDCARLAKCQRASGQITACDAFVLSLVTLDRAANMLGVSFYKTRRRGVDWAFYHLKKRGYPVVRDGSAIYLKLNAI